MDELNPIDLKFKYYTGPERIILYPEVVLLDPLDIVEMLNQEELREQLDGIT